MTGMEKVNAYLRAPADTPRLERLRLRAEAFEAAALWVDGVPVGAARRARRDLEAAEQAA